MLKPWGKTGVSQKGRFQPDLGRKISFFTNRNVKILQNATPFQKIIYYNYIITQKTKNHKQKNCGPQRIFSAAHSIDRLYCLATVKTAVLPLISHSLV